MKIKNKVLLVTGGTGSFGNAIIEKFIQTDHFKEIRIFSRDEKKQHDLRLKYNSNKLKYYIGDVRNLASLDEAMDNVDYVFHAAALKQVPSCEFFPLEATYTNVIGTSNVLKSAIEKKVSKVVCLSTDKAAYPINAMGITKALMEKVAVASSRKSNDTVICLTRYGNVMASRGSVIPLFVDQAIHNRPLSVTNPEMTRFLMSLDEAVDLVLFAFENGSDGDLFVCKSPSVYIKDLAKAIKEIFRSSSKVETIGVRVGEKHYETLCTQEEMLKAIDMGGYFKVLPEATDLNFDKYFFEGNHNIYSENGYNSKNTKILSVDQIKDKLLSIDYIKSKLANL